MLTIWGRSNSVNVQKVLWCCEECGIEYRRLDAGGPYGVVDTPEYRKMNPNGLVPTLDDDGFILWESHAIVRYLLDTRAPGTLLPADRRARALAEQWMDWANASLWPALRPLFLGLIRTPPEKRDPEVLEDSRLKSAAQMVLLDRHLAGHTYLAGDQFTAGDVAVGCGVWRWMALPIERTELPHLRRWFDLLAARPAYRRVVMLPLT
jgi:glutathione S-transferase